MFVQPYENEIVPEPDPVFLCPNLESHRAEWPSIYIALETHCLSSKPGITTFYLGSLGDLMNLPELHFPYL